jgi:hypothetical protein
MEELLAQRIDYALAYCPQVTTNGEPIILLHTPYQKKPTMNDPNWNHFVPLLLSLNSTFKLPRPRNTVTINSY